MKTKPVQVQSFAQSQIKALTGHSFITGSKNCFTVIAGRQEVSQNLSLGAAPSSPEEGLRHSAYLLLGTVVVQIFPPVADN